MEGFPVAAVLCIDLLLLRSALFGRRANQNRAQSVISNNPEVESLDIVEINPGYLSLIEDYPAVSSLLHNPRVHIHIDDARPGACGFRHSSVTLRLDFRLN
jgi:hypothetical protein